MCWSDYAAELMQIAHADLLAAREACDRSWSVGWPQAVAVMKMVYPGRRLTRTKMLTFVSFASRDIANRRTNQESRAIFVQEMSEVQERSGQACPHGPPAPFEYPPRRNKTRHRSNHG